MILGPVKGIWARVLPISNPHSISFGLLVAAALMALSLTSGFANPVDSPPQPRVEKHALWATRRMLVRAPSQCASL